MSNLNNIGIDKNKAAQIAEKLNTLLADYQIYYQNLRGFHWNIRGKEFFELHAKFEELYNDTQLKIDEIAERILMLGEQPLHSFDTYLENASITAHKNVTNGMEAAGLVVENLKQLLADKKTILPVADEAGDEGTLDLITTYINDQEKNIWMFSAYLG